MNPSARLDGLFTVEVGGDLLVYEKERAKAHYLNPTAALVWRHCDGQTSIAELALLLQRELSLPADDDLVWLTLRRLDRAHLLVEHVPHPVAGSRPTRRELVQKLGLAGGLALLLPVVESIAAPTLAMAQSSGGPCGPGGTCPTGFLCIAGTCVVGVTPNTCSLINNNDCPNAVQCFDQGVPVGRCMPTAGGSKCSCQ